VSTLLEVGGATRRFGGVFAVRDVDLTVRTGETHAVIGPNGAGKSTLFKLIGGQLAPTAGTFHYEGERIDRLAPHRRARRGIAIAFQDAPVFHGLTVAENAMVGAHAVTRAGPLAAVLRLPRHRREEREIRELAFRSLDRVGLSDQAGRPADSLPLGQQRALQMARALCGGPRLLLLDEPASGLRGPERSALAALIEQLRGEGLSILLVEHDVAFVARLADRVTVLDLGRVIASGPFPQIRADERVIAAYLGGTDLDGSDHGGTDLDGSDLGDADRGSADRRDPDRRDPIRRDSNLSDPDRSGANRSDAEQGSADRGDADRGGVDRGGAA
jgi:branched-chain amino acid transport system ATP-binding protein